MRAACPGDRTYTWEDNTPWPVAACLRSVSRSTDSYMAYSQSGLRAVRIHLQHFCLQSESWQFPQAPYCPPPWPLWRAGRDPVRSSVFISTGSSNSCATLDKSWCEDLHPGTSIPFLKCSFALSLSLPQFSEPQKS